MNLRGIVPFPAAGEGLVVHFPVSALIALEAQYGSGDAWSVIETRIANGAADVTEKCLSLGLRVVDGNKTVPVMIPMDDWKFSIQEAAVPILDALCLSYFGTDYAKQIEMAQARNAMEDLAALKSMAEAGEADDPLKESSEPTE